MIKIGEGEFGEVFRIEEGKVVKLFKLDNFDKEAFEDEYKITKYLGQVTDFTPKVFEQIVIDSRQGYIMEEIEGKLFFDVIEEDQKSMTSYGALLGRAHKKLHDRQVTQDLNHVPKFKSFMERFLTKNNVFSKAVNTWMMGLLNELEGDDSLLHSDFMPNNIIYLDGDLKVLDWAEPSLGPAVADVARTLNFLMDFSDFRDANITKYSNDFIKGYLDGYYYSDTLNIEQLQKAFILNAASEVAWAEHSKQNDDYSEFLKSFIMDNFNASESIYLDSLRDYIKA